MAFLIEQAGGAATTGTRPILDVLPTDVHDRVPCIRKCPTLASNPQQIFFLSTLCFSPQHPFSVLQWGVAMMSPSFRASTRQAKRHPRPLVTSMMGQLIALPSRKHEPHAWLR